MRRARRAATALAPALLVAASGAALAAGCDRQKAAVGTWELTSLDGVRPSVATPVRVLFPPVKYGADTMATHGMWHEVTFDSLTLTLGPDGAFRERAVEGKRTLTRPNTFERPDYVSGAFGGDLVRDPAQPGVLESAGAWTLTADTLALTEDRARFLADLSARVQQALPGVSAADAQAALDAALPATDAPRWKGVVKGDRLELVDSAGRRYGFRKAGSGR